MDACLCCVVFTNVIMPYLAEMLGLAVTLLACCVCVRGGRE